MTNNDFNVNNGSSGGKLAPGEVKVLMAGLMISLLVGA